MSFFVLGVLTTRAFQQLLVDAKVELISVPVGQDKPVETENYINKDMDGVEMASECLLCTDEESAELLEENHGVELPPLYWDPKLARSRKAYKGLLKRWF